MLSAPFAPNPRFPVNLRLFYSSFSFVLIFLTNGNIYNWQKRIYIHVSYHSSWNNDYDVQGKPFERKTSKRKKMRLMWYETGKKEMKLKYTKILGLKGFHFFIFVHARVYDRGASYWEYKIRLLAYRIWWFIEKSTNVEISKYD